MFQFEKTVFGNINIEKLWGLYSDVSCWKDWDMDVEQVVLDGAFIQGGHGVMSMKNGQSLPFVLDHVDREKAFTTRCDLGAITVSFVHIITGDSITHTVLVEGLEERQLDGIGKGISANLPNTLNTLLSMVVQ